MGKETKRTKERSMAQNIPGTVVAKKRNDASAIMLLLIFFLVAIAIALTLLSLDNGVNPGIRPIKPDVPGKIADNASWAVKKFNSNKELKDFLEEGAANSYSGMMFSRDVLSSGSNMMKESASDTSVPQWGEVNLPSNAPASVPTDASSGDYSTTNVQVSGVDEADIVKTDGEYIYAVSGNDVVIVRAYPAEGSEIVSKIELDSAPQNIYLNGDSLAVYGQKWNFENEKALNDILMPIGRTSFTYLKIYDISDRKKPKEARSLYFEGSNANSRMIGDYIYLVTSSYPYYGYMRQAEDEDIIAPLIIEDGEILNNGGKDIACKGCPNMYYFDIPYNSYTYTTISSINIKDTSEKVKSEVFLLDQSQNNIYVSEKNIYITYTKYVNEESLMYDISMGLVKEFMYPVLSAKDREMVTEIENTKNYILSPEEKFAKIGLIMQKYEKEFAGREEELTKELEKRVKKRYEDISKELEKTVIHKIAISSGDLKYDTSGEVTGMVLSQFSMDENAGYFRIATTKNRTWSNFAGNSGESYSNIYVLDGSMKVVGKVEDIARGEQIYSVRFMQGRAYMVTFKQTDPLFVIDLKDSADPKILGKLKVPGFSSYLHPYDETTLIGLGKESDETGRIIGGVKLSLFDVSDVENPKELDKYVIGDSSSDSLAINEHKAFLFSKDKNLLVIPVSVQGLSPLATDQGISLQEQEMMVRPMPVPPTSPMPPAYSKYFNGAYVFSIDKFRFNLKGEINHADKADDSWWNYGVGVQRSLYIKDILYTLSGKYLKANKIEGLEEVKTVELPGYSNINPVPMMK